MKHAGFYYTSNPFYPCPDFVARHWERGVVPGLANLQAIQAVNPDFVAYTYESITDNYTSTDEATMYEAICAALGVDYESVFLHWGEETTVHYPSGDITYPAGARIRVYWGGNQSGFNERCAVSFLPAVQPVHLERCRRVLTDPWGGLMLDNCASSFYNYGTILSGGLVAEAGFKINTSAYSAWHWSHLREFLPILRAAIKPKALAINVANIWSEDYLDLLVADDLVQESVGNPIRDFFPNIPELIRRHKKAAMLGTRIWCSANTATKGAGDATVTYPVMQYGCLALGLVVGEETTRIHIQDWTGPNRPDWPSRIVSPAEMGESGHPLARMLGTPAGDAKPWPLNPRSGIWLRQFQLGIVYAKVRSSWNAPVDEMVSIKVPAGHAWVRPDGGLDRVPAVDVPNGGGAIFVRH